MKKTEKNNGGLPRTGQREHRFALVVKTHADRKSAELAVMSAFALRQADGYEFHLRSISGEKETWMAGARAGTETAFELVIRSLNNLRKTCGARRKNKP